MNKEYLTILINLQTQVDNVISTARKLDGQYAHDRSYDMEKISEAVADEIRKEANR